MRVSQIQNLTWAGNALVLAGLAWVGWQFLQTSRQKPSLEFAWQKAKAEQATGPRVPEFSTFAKIWDTPINGKVPPPPAPPVEVVQKKDRWTEFQGDLKWQGGWEFITEPDRSVARLNYKGKDISVTPGSDVGGSGFQLLGVTVVTTPDNDRNSIARLVFRHPETGAIVTKDMPITQGPGLPAGSQKPFKPTPGKGAVDPDVVPRNGPLGRTAFEDSTSPGTWVIPEDEQNWIALYGEEDIVAKLPTKPDVDAQGVSHGLRIMAPIEATAPALAPSHGISQGDFIRSINGVPVTSKEDIVNYLRGPGKGLARYEVAIETAGKPRTIVYRVQRVSRRSPR